MDDHLKQLLLLGREHYEQREYAKAEYLLRQVVAKTDSFADVHHMLGVVAHSRGDFVRAESHFQRAVELNPNYTEAQLNLMVTYNELGKYDAAREVYAKVRELGGDRPDGDQFARGKIANMHAEISAAYADLGMGAEAIRELDKAIELCPQFSDLRTKLGILLRDSGDRAGARRHFEAAKLANPRYVPARTMLGVLLLGDQQPEDAVREFEAVLELDPENKTAQMYLKLARAAGPKPSPS
jgi:tetratricopeptide (TPR) repeat protein